MLALRLYTTDAFRRINTPLRDVARDEAGAVLEPTRLATPHPWPVTVAFLYEALKKCRSAEELQDDESDKEEEEEAPSWEAPGTVVRHATRGEGVVAGVEADGRTRVDFTSGDTQYYTRAALSRRLQHHQLREYGVLVKVQ